MDEKPLLNVYTKYIEDGKYIRVIVNDEYVLDYDTEKPVIYEDNIKLRKKDRKKQAENLEAIIGIVTKRGHKVTRKNFYGSEYNIVEEGLKAIVLNFVKSGTDTYKSQFYEDENGELKGRLHAKFECVEDPPVRKDMFAEALVIWKGEDGYEVVVKGWPDELSDLDYGAVMEGVDRYAYLVHHNNNLKMYRYEYIRLFNPEWGDGSWVMNPPMRDGITSPKDIDRLKFHWECSHVNGCKGLYKEGSRPKLIGKAYRGSNGISNPLECNWKFHPLTQALAHQKLKDHTPVEGTAWVLLEVKSINEVEATTLFVVGNSTSDLECARFYSHLLVEHEWHLTLEDKAWLSQWMWRYAPLKYYEDRINHKAFSNVGLSPLISNKTDNNEQKD